MTTTDLKWQKLSLMNHTWSWTQVGHEFSKKETNFSCEGVSFQSASGSFSSAHSQSPVSALIARRTG